MTNAPPIPQRLDGRPTLGGLVVPYVSVSDGRQHLLGQVHRSRALTCIRDHLCQVDGEPLGGRRVVFATATGVAEQYSGEAALHPECAAYSAMACPMLHGAMATFRGAAPALDRIECFEPGCNCGGWKPAAGTKSHAGAPAEPWFAVWLDTYHLATTSEGELHGLAWIGLTPLRVRPVPAVGTAQRPR